MFEKLLNEYRGARTERGWERQERVRTDRPPTHTQPLSFPSPAPPPPVPFSRLALYANMQAEARAPHRATTLRSPSS